MKVKEEKIYIDKKNAERDVGDPEVFSLAFL